MGFIDYYLDNFKQKKINLKLILQKPNSNPDQTTYLKDKLK